MEVTMRGKLRAQLTKLCKSASDIIKTIVWEHLKKEDYEDNRLELECLIKRISDINEKVKKNNDIILAKISEEEMDKECDIVLEYEDKVVVAIAQLENALERLSRCNSGISATTPENAQRQVEVRTPHVSSLEVKLKRLELRKFNGNFEEWLPFWEQFRVAVHENETLSDSMKFNYLSTALEGKAAATIAGYLPTAECYKEVIKALKTEYGNTNKLIEKYIQKLVNIKSVTLSSDVKGLRYLYNEISSAMRTLETLHVEPSQYGLIIKSILLRAIPNDWRINYYKSNSNSEEDNIKNLLEFMKNETEAMEKANLSGKEERDPKKYQKNPTATATSLFVNSNVRNMYCVFCKNNTHRSKDCKSKTSVENKKKMLRDEGRCYKCANKSHTSRNCKAHWIQCDVCAGRHITPLCEKTINNVRAENSEKRDGKEPTNTNTIGTVAQANLSTALNTTTQTDQTDIYLQTACATVMDHKQKKKVISRIIMDNGSQRSFITQSLREKLKLKKYVNQGIKIMSFGGNADKNSVLYETVILKIQGQYNDEVRTIKAVVVPKICDDILPSAEKIKNILNIEKLELADTKPKEDIGFPGINLLIGQDYYWEFNYDKCQILSKHLVAVHTFFGWTIQGCETQTQQMSYVFNINQQIEETFDVSKFWNLESIGINNNEYKTEGKTTNIKIKWVNKRYQVSLPWKNLKTELNDNKKVALKRLRTLTIKLLNNNNIMNYDKQISEMVMNGIAEKVIHVQNNSNRKYYMPHKAVYREEKTTSKTRIVFDASSSEKGCLSLNDHLLQGEEMVADLLTILLSFRMYEIAIVADIEKAFLQIAIDPNDRDVHRFLWYDVLPKQDKILPEPVEYRMTRVTFGITSSPFLLARTIKQHLENFKTNHEDVCEKLGRSFYVDDLIMSESNEENAKNIIQKSLEIMGVCGFNLRKWNSNKPKVLQNLPEEAKENRYSQKVLGVKWCTISDEISVDIESSLEYIRLLTPTKRNVLKAMAKIFDPIGILGPFTVLIKILLQKVWSAGVDWDELLPKNLMDDFTSWKNDLDKLTNFSIKRCLVPREDDNIELHIFADASPLAYGAVAYIRRKTTKGIVSINLICSKNRIRPMKKETNSTELTLPKLELTAALIAARLKLFLTNSIYIKFNSILLWSDSTIALDWIKGRGSQLHAYVKTRKDEINKLTNVYDWKHCRGKTNPADLLTRGLKAKVLNESHLWKYGPPWLMDNLDDTVTNETIELLTTTISSEPNEEMEPILTIEKFGSFKRLMRVTAWVMRFKKLISKQKTNLGCKELHYEELLEAESYWIRTVQAASFKNEITSLLKNNYVANNSYILMLNPMLDDGILKVRNRLQNQTNPIILPKCYLSKLLINECHYSTLHGGVNMVLTQLRKKYWMIKGRQMIKKEIQRCVICKRLRGKPGSEPWTVIPIERISTTRIFETTGIDFAGPLYVYQRKTEEQSKVYIMLFTCAAIRAVHLELVCDMTTISCIAALRRFFARWGTPSTIISDNARTFKRADAEFRKLESLMKSETVQTFAAHKEITWKYIPERAAWWGGFWERLVKSVKTALKAAIGNSRLTFDELNTILTEAESVTNARPLTYISNDKNDLEPLTPSHFINNAKLLIPAEFKNDGSELAKSWELRQLLTKKYLKRWKTEYLSQLRTLHFNKNNAHHNIEHGDVVLVHDENKPRLLWKMALVIATYPGRDGRVRVCEVRMGNGNVLKRPIQLLYPLEISRRGGRM